MPNPVMSLRIRYAVGAFVRNRKNQYLVVRKKRKKTGNHITGNYWDIPKGGVEKGESLLHALKRELKEELGTTKFRNFKNLTQFIYYDYPSEFQKASSFKGQKNFLFEADFVGNRKDIRIDHMEIDKFCFVSAKNFANKLTYPSTKKVFKQIIVKT
jgi:putative (di)nucleoside polyphosphate hydrolase